MNARRVWIALALAVAPMGADLPTPPDTERSPTRALPPAEAAAGFRAPPGFRVGVFAAEPDVRNPVAMAWDTRGRLWVAENYTYSDASDRFDMRLRDRVLIFEDADRDGRFDRRTVFTDDVQRLASVEPGFGGTWLLCPPQLLFVPDRDHDDRPDGPAEVILDGFEVVTDNHHTFANGLRWGPDGWLYGRCGASSPGEIGTPGTPTNARIPLRGGIWRFDPKSRRFEALAHGTTNPWGHDWDALGEAFFINTVNGHLWHLIPGSHLARPHTIEPNPRVYSIIDTHSDHYHFDNSKDFNRFTLPGSIDDVRGGGHAHVGMTIYAGGQWPDSYRGKLLTLNLHGRRTNVERLERAGSGFVGRHEPDILAAADPWFRGIDLSYGPDGSVFLLDWSDTGECHDHDGVHRNSGRIYRVTYGDVKPAPMVDLATLDDAALVALHRHPNEWHARTARRVLAERAAAGRLTPSARASLRDLFATDPDPARKFRALATIATIGDTDPAFLRSLLAHPHEAMRTWGVRLLSDAWPIDTIFSQRGGPDVEPAPDLLAAFDHLAATEPSGLVRLALASTLQRLPVAQRAVLATRLAARAEDANDHNLPPLIWTALIPVADADPSALVGLAKTCVMPVVRRSIARRLGEDVESRPGPLAALIDAAASGDEAFRGEVVAGLSEALHGWRKATKPAGWDRLRSGLSGTVSLEWARDLDVLFGDGRALDEVRRVALDNAAPLDARRSALRTLVEARPPDLRAVCERLLKVRFLNAIAARGLALFDDPEVGKKLAASYRSFHPSDRPATLDTLASRPGFALALLDAVASGAIPRADLTPFLARQIRSLGDPAATARLAAVWGEQRETPADRLARIVALKAGLTPEALKHADLGNGRATFDRVCAACHALYGQGGDVGPDLTGAGRSDLGYLLENLVDPSATVPADYRMVVVATKDGRVLNGLIRARTARTITVRTQNEAITLDLGDVEAIKPSPLSLMPEGQLDALKPDDARDLIAYLMGRTQVPASTPRIEPTR